MPKPLEGRLVLDLGWLMVAPISARMLGELGARVIKIESSNRPDPVRGLGGSAASYHMINAGKEGLALNLAGGPGRKVLAELIAKADVLIESFTPGVIDRMGFSFPEVGALNPRIVMVSTGILGRTGPFGMGTSGTGSTGSAFAGATRMMGMPGRQPDGPSGPWTDAVTPRYLVPGVLAALRHADRTGRGEHLDIAQAEAGLQFLLPAMTDHAVNGRVTDARGKVIDPHRAPCAAYPARGVDRWVVIDASDPAAYDALARLVGGVLAEPRFARLLERLRHRDAIDAAIAAWTQDRDAQEVELLLQRDGVPAHVASENGDLTGDGDLRDAGFLEHLPDGQSGGYDIPGPLFRLRATPADARTSGPGIGSSNSAVLGEILGYSPDRVQELEDGGVLT